MRTILALICGACLASATVSSRATTSAADGWANASRQASDGSPAAEGSDEPTDKIDQERGRSAEEALSRVEGIDDVDVTVDGGSATVSGIANDPAIVEQAEAVVRASTGAEVIQNDVELTGDFAARVEGATVRVAERVEAWLAFLPLLPIAVATLLGALVLSWVVGKWNWPFERLAKNPFLRDILQRLAQAAVLLVGVLIVLEFLDATALVGGVLGAAGVAGIAIGFAFRDLVENYIASVLLSLRQPFCPRDHVLIDGHEGLVTSMNSRSTVLTTFDGNVVRIPNATVFKTTLINYTADSRRRFSFDVGVGYDVDLADATGVGTRIVLETEGVMADPAPFAAVRTLGDSSIVVRLYGWVDQARHDFLKVRSAAMQRVKLEYDARNIDMPEPIYKIKMSESLAASSGSQVRKQPPRSGAMTSEFDVTRDRTAEELADQSEIESTGENLLDEDGPRE